MVIWNSCNEEAPGQEFGKVEIDLSRSSEMRSYSLENCSDSRAAIALEVTTTIVDEDDAGKGNTPQAKSRKKEPVGGFGNYKGGREETKDDYDENSHHNYASHSPRYRDAEEDRRYDSGDYGDYSYPDRGYGRNRDDDGYFNDRRGGDYDRGSYNDRRDDYGDDDDLRGSPSSYNGVGGSSPVPDREYDQNYERVYEDDGFGMRPKGSPTPLSRPPGMGLPPGMGDYDDRDLDRDQDRDRDRDRDRRDYFDIDDDEFGVNREYLGDDDDGIDMEEIKDDPYSSPSVRNASMHKHTPSKLPDPGVATFQGALPKPKIEDAWA